MNDERRRIRWAHEAGRLLGRALLFDPRTSGGLLLLVPEAETAAFLDDVPRARVIGRALPAAPKPLIVRG